MRRIVLALAAVLGAFVMPAAVQAQSASCPAATFGTYGSVPTPGQWALCLNSLQPSISLAPNSIFGTTASSGAPSGLPMPAASGANQALGWTPGVGPVTVPIALTGTTAAIGGAALTAGQCASATVSISGSVAADAVAVSPETYPGDGFWWEGYVSAAGTVTVKVCAAVAGTPAASVYAVRVLQ